MKVAAKSAGKFPEMKNSKMVIVIFKRDFPEKMKSSSNENQELHRVDPSTGINKQQSIHQTTTNQARIERI
jgi:hypothetical protein